MEKNTHTIKKGETLKMEETFTPTKPVYSGDGAAIWEAKDKNGKTYLKVKKPEWSKAINCFKVEEKKTQ
jgi:hypothetical protein